MRTRSREAAVTRCRAGPNAVIDDDIGLLMGRQVGRLVCSLDRAGEA